MPKLAALLFTAAGLAAQTPASRPSFDAFEAASIKPTPPEFKGGRFIVMQSAHWFNATNYTLKLLIAAAYNLPPGAIAGGPAWFDSDHYDIAAATPNSVRPTRDEQMAMLRKLLADRCKLAYHREQKELPVYALSIARSGAKLKESTAPADEPAGLINTVFPDHIRLPARNATITEFASMLQRAVVDRPVLDRTGLTGKYDFDLEWTPDETQFQGQGPGTPDAPRKPDLFAALQQQLGLRLEATRGPVAMIVVDHVERPTEN